MTTDNLRIWNALKKTDPKATKRFKRAGGFEGTSVKPIYCDEKMTEMFGPCGIGWGVSEPQYQLVNGAEGEVAVYCWLTLWYRDPATGEKSEPVPGVGGDFVIKKNKYGLTADDEAFKKAATDAIGNAMKHIGVAADIHMGQHDDDKYVTELRREIDGEQKQQRQTRPPADDNTPLDKITDPRELAKRMVALIVQAENLKALNELMLLWGEQPGKGEPKPGSLLAKLPDGGKWVGERADGRRGVLAQEPGQKAA